MSDFLVKELKEKEGLWVTIDDCLVFIDRDETHYHLPKDVTITSYEVRNFSKDIQYLYMEKKQFHTFKSAIKDATKKVVNKKEGYRYGIYLHYKRESGKNGACWIASIRKGTDDVELQLPKTRTLFANGSLEEDEKKWIEQSTIPPSWTASRRVNRPILLLEKELKEVHGVKDILYTASHPHKEKERFLRTLEHYFCALSKEVDTSLFPPLTISHGKNKRFAGNYLDWTKEMVLQPTNYTSFFHLYWFHLYYDGIDIILRNPAFVLFDSLVKTMYEEETMTKHLKQYEYILNKKGEVLAKYKQKKSGHYHEQFTSPHQMMARLFSDYFFYHYEDTFDAHERKRSFHFTVSEIDLFSPSLEELLKEMQKTKKKES